MDIMSIQRLEEQKSLNCYQNSRNNGQKGFHKSMTQLQEKTDGFVKKIKQLGNEKRRNTQRSTLILPQSMLDLLLPQLEKKKRTGIEYMSRSRLPPTYSSNDHLPTNDSMLMRVDSGIIVPKTQMKSDALFAQLFSQKMTSPEITQHFVLPKRPKKPIINFQEDKKMKKKLVPLRTDPSSE